MSWVFYALGAIVSVAISDMFRKLGSNLHDAFLSNLIFQIGSVTMAVTLWLLFSRRLEDNAWGLTYALIGGMLVSIFTAFVFKALEIGPGVSVVMPVIRVGGVMLVAILGVLVFGEKMSTSLALGILLSVTGVYLIFSGK